jgi:hypothetical protein
MQKLCKLGRVFGSGKTELQYMWMYMLTNWESIHHRIIIIEHEIS